MSAMPGPGGGPGGGDESLGTRKPWEPKPADVRNAVTKYSHFVSTMKILLPSLALLLLALVLILPQFRDDPNEFSADIVSVRDGEAGSLSLINARYFGIDDSGQPFSVTADSVRESAEGDDDINLVSPQADISMNDDTWLVVGADAGRYDRGSQVLELVGGVNLFQDQGYELHTDAATVDLNQGKAVSTKPARTTIKSLLKFIPKFIYNTPRYRYYS